MLQAVQKIILVKQKISTLSLEILTSTSKILMTSLKNILVSFKNLKRVLTGEEKILIPSFKILIVSFGILVSSFLIMNNTYADENSNLNYSVTVEPALNITTSSNKVSLDLNPLNHDFDSQDLTVSVSTNNETGYKLYVNTEKTTNNPNGNKLIEKDDHSLYIDTLSSEVPENSFTANRWGYKLNSGNYLPFVPGTLINSSKTQIENNSSTLTFAAKVGYETKAGTYALALNFQATANPKCNTTVEGTMQEFDPCPDLEDGTKGTLIDVRDGATYTVAKINGNWWMTQNLRYVGDTGSASNSMTIKSATTNINEDKVMAYTDLTTVPYNDYDNAKIHNSGNTTNGVWYNYAAASAMTITGSSNENEQRYDLCPKNWRLPTEPEQSDVTSYRSAYFDNSNPVGGGYYANGSVAVTTSGYWWSATAHDATSRHNLDVDTRSSTFFVVSHTLRRTGICVRCIRAS